MARRSAPTSQQVIDAEFRAEPGSQYGQPFCQPAQVQSGLLRGYGFNFGSFGYSVSGLAAMQSLYNTAQLYANATDAVGASPFLLGGVTSNLNFSTGMGARLTRNEISFEAYVAALQGAVEGIIYTRQSVGMDASEVIDWWSNIGLPQTHTLALAEKAYATIKPAADTAGEAAKNLFDTIPGWVKLMAGGLIVVIFLGQLKPFMSAAKTFLRAAPKRQAVAGYGQRKRRSRRVKSIVLY